MSADSFAWFQIGINSATGEIRILPVGGIAMQNGAVVSCRERIEQYLQWLSEFGGKDGRQSSQHHVTNARIHLTAWQGDPAFPVTVSGITPTIVEAHINAMRNAKKLKDGKEVSAFAPMTVRHRFTSLKSFINWCVKRKHLPEDPIKACVKPNGTPEKQSRTLTYEEFARLYHAAKPNRQIIYRTAVQTAFRQNEMRSLDAGSHDETRHTLKLLAEHEKTRQAVVFPITEHLSDLLSGWKDCYESAHGELFKFSVTPIQEFDRDLVKAGVDKTTQDGTIDFHGLRRTAITWFEEVGATESQIRAFGRHSGGGTTHRYRRVKLDDLRPIMLIVEQRLEEALNAENSGGLAQLGERQAGSLLLSVFQTNASSALDLAYKLGSEQQKAQFRALTDSIFRDKLGGGTWG